VLVPDRAIGVVTGCGLDDRGDGVHVPVGSRIFSTSFRPALESTQPSTRWIPGAVSPRVKRPGREAEHSPPTSAESKKIHFPMKLHGVVHEQLYLTLPVNSIVYASLYGAETELKFLKNCCIIKHHVINKRFNEVQ
jgi:hypothetical protein